MTQENKELLLRDLCARLPYGVKVRCDFGLDGEITEISRTKNNLYYCKYLDCKEGYCYIESLKPYLFPLSSMTEEQKRNLTSLFNCHVEITQYEIKFSDYHDSNMDNWNKVFNWCYKNHFDINGLITMGLAIDATNLNIY